MLLTRRAGPPMQFHSLADAVQNAVTGDLAGHGFLHFGTTFVLFVEPVHDVVGS
jgi:hypothetical protein